MMCQIVSRPTVAAGLAVAVALLVVVRPAEGQDPRRQATERMRETELKIEKAASDQERQALRDRLEAYRHELGYRDADNRHLQWEVSCQRQLIERLDREIRDAEGQGKGGWALVPLADDVRRAWRIIARDLLQRSDSEHNSRNRQQYGFTGILLARNADVLDALAARLTEIEAALKKLPDDDAHRDLRRRLGGGWRAGQRFRDLGRDVRDNRQPIDFGKIDELGRRLRQLHAAVVALDDMGSGSAQASEDDADDDESDAALERRMEAVRTRAKSVAETLPEVAGHVTAYLGQVAVGLEHEAARPLALELLQNLERATAAAASIAESRVLPDDERTAAVERLTGAVELIGKPDRRDDAYGELRRIERDQRQRELFDRIPASDDACRALWQARQWAEKKFDPKAPDSPERQLYEKTRNSLNRLAWQARDAGDRPLLDDRYLAAAVRDGRRMLTQRIERAAESARAHSAEIEQAVWDVEHVLNELNRVYDVDDSLRRAAHHAPVADALRRAAAVYARDLFDDDRSNDGYARRRLNDFRDALDLVGEFHAIAAERGDRSEAMRLSRGKYYSLQRVHASRTPLLLKSSLEGDRAESDALRDVMPVYRLTAECLALTRAEAAGTLDRLRVVERFTADPQAVSTRAAQAAQLLPEVFLALSKARPEEVDDAVAPVINAELLLRAPVVALVTVGEQSYDRPGALLAALRDAGQDGPPNWMRYDWAIAWHANQALAALAADYPQTAAYHTSQLAYMYRRQRTTLAPPEETTD